LARIFALTPCISGRRFKRTIGVSPIVSVIESKIRPRPGSFFGAAVGLRNGSAIRGLLTLERVGYHIHGLVSTLAINNKFQMLKSECERVSATPSFSAFRH